MSANERQQIDTLIRAKNEIQAAHDLLHDELVGLREQHMTARMLVDMAVAFRVEAYTQVEARKGPEGADGKWWAVVRHGQLLRRNGAWDYEVKPDARSDAFRELFYYDSLEAAFNAFGAWREANPQAATLRERAGQAPAEGDQQALFDVIQRVTREQPAIAMAVSAYNTGEIEAADMVDALGISEDQLNQLAGRTPATPDELNAIVDAVLAVATQRVEGVLAQLPPTVEELKAAAEDAATAMQGAANEVGASAWVETVTNEQIGAHLATASGAARDERGVEPGIARQEV